ncbi:MAG: hypothetical protein B7Y47_06935 [Sphingomonas sp. 28-63-12]|nr:MAG: hypothetical protein B7Y47_06935 [Sphingomonas sp. 28-63-12]
MGRHYGMDWLRIGAFGLLIFYHIGLVFVHWAYHAKTAHPMPWVAVPLQAINAWRLPLLFLVSGYASRAIFTGDKRAGTFTWNRTKRLIPPLLFGVIVIVPVQPWIELVTQHGYNRDFLTFWTRDYFRFGTLGGIALPTWQHLWFVGYLWVYTVVLAILLTLLPVHFTSALSRWADSVLSGPLILALPIALLIGNWIWIYPGARETHGFIDDWPVHRVYFAMFLFGFLLRKSAAVWAAIRRWWRWAAVLAVGGYAVVASIEIAYLGPYLPSRALWFWFGVARAVQSWGAIVALIGIADRYLNHDHRLRPMLTEAVFPFYLIHQTIIVLVAGELLAFGLPPLAEFAIILAATITGCWAFYRIGREIGWLRPLIGLRTRLSRPAAAI